MFAHPAESFLALRQFDVGPRDPFLQDQLLLVVDDGLPFLQLNKGRRITEALPCRHCTQFMYCMQCM